MSVENQEHEPVEEAAENPAETTPATPQGAAEEGEAPDPDGDAEPAEAEAAAVGAAPSDDAEATEAGTEAAEAEATEPATSAKPVNENLKWYAVHTFSNFEEKARDSLLEKAKLEGMEHYFGEVLVPTEEITEIVGGKKRSRKKRFYPGYMFVQMELNDHTWHVLKDTPKVTGFVGDARNPVPLKKREVAKLTQQVTEGAIEKQPRVVYLEGETIRVKEGSFANFNGEIEEVKEEQKKLRVRVSIFGRPTPVELAFDQVEKILK